MILQRGSLCVALISQVPEHRPGVAPIVDKAVRLLDLMLDRGIAVLTEVDDDDDDDDNDVEEPEEDDDEALAAVS